MATYVDPQGREFEVPDDPTPQETAEIRQMQLRPKGDEHHGKKDFAKSAISGGLEGVVRAPLIGGDLAKLAMLGVNKLRPGTVEPETMEQFGSQGWIDAFKGSPQDKWLRDKLGLEAAYEPQTKAGRYGKAVSSAVTGGATMGGMGAAPGLMQSGAQGLNAARVALTPGMLAINGGAGAAAELGYDVSRGFDDTKEGNPLAALAAGMGAGTTGQIFRTIRAPNLDQVLYNALKGTGKDEWTASRADLKDFKQSGSQSFTLADLPKLQSRIGGLARGMSNATGGDLLQQKLSLQQRMNTDIPKLMKDTLEGTHSAPVDPREIAELMATRGTARVDGAKRQRFTALAGNLDNAGSVNPVDLLRETNATVRKAMIQPGNQSVGTRQALDAAEEALIGKKNLPPMIAQATPNVLNVRSLSHNVKSLRDVPTREAGNPKTAMRNSDRDLAATQADEALKRASPGYRQAMQQYGDTTENLVNPLKKSLPGMMSDAKSFDGVMERLRKVPADKLQAEINSMGLTDDEVLRLAKAVGTNLHPVPNMAMAGDMRDREIFTKLVDYVDPDLAKHLGKKVSVADALSRLSSEHSSDRTLGLNLSKNAVSNMVNPFGTISLRAGLRTSEKQTAQISELIGNPTPQNLAKLQELSKVDPRAKRALEWLSTAAAAMSAGQQHR